MIEPGANPVPFGLIDAIQAGECVAFVGAGFSAAANLPQWGALLSRLAETKGVPLPIREHVEGRIKIGTGHTLDEAAQVLQDVFARDKFIRLLRKQLSKPKLTPAVKDRLAWLRGIPFRAVLTTNFDGVLEGEIPGKATYRTTLRSTPLRWWDEEFWRREGSTDSLAGAPTIKLHGDLKKPKSVVLSRLDYRRRLYENPAYMGFLRAILARQTILYLGFSFADAYLNELRSEALALLGGGPTPVAYAVLNVPPVTRKHLLKNEGIQVLNYEATNDNHSGFDRILKSIHDQTNPAVRFGQLLKGARILWVDQEASDNQPVFDFLERAAKLSGVDPAIVDHELDHEKAIVRIAAHQADDTPYDLVITRWGHGLAHDGAGSSIAIGERILREVRKQDLRLPVLVFSSGDHMDENKRSAAKLGAQGYFHTFGGILRGIERVFATGVESV